MIDHRELSRLLAGAGAEAPASACHGFLCGQICASEFPDEELWMEFLDVQRRDDATAEHVYEGVRSLAADIESQFQQEDFGFQLLLPDDDQGLAERVDALGEWCNGFLQGFTLGAEQLDAAMTEDCREVLDDLAVIANVSVEQPGDGDEGELVEVVEYVRVGVMTLFEAARHGRGTGAIH